MEYEAPHISVRPHTLLDKEMFQQISEIASVMASASLIPESLSHEGSGNNRTALPYETVRANCFLVANQAVKWRMDPFAVAQCCSVVHGRLMFEGKLVASVLDANLGIKLVHAYGKWDSAKEECVLGEAGTGDDLAIRIGEGHYAEDGSAVFSGRYIDGCVGLWKTTGIGTPWRPGRNRVMLVYRGSREFARIFEPGVMLGVITDDEYDPAFNARDITPRPTASAGGSIIERLRAEKNGGAAGFDKDRVASDIDTATGKDRSSVDEGRDSSTTEAEASASASSSKHDDVSTSSSQADVAEGSGDSSSQTSEPSSDHMEWLFNVVRMLWAATTAGGDPAVLKAQRKAAAAAFPPDGVPKAVTDKAASCFDYCMKVVAGEIEPEDAISIIAGVCGRSEEDFRTKS